MKSGKTIIFIGVLVIAIVSTLCNLFEWKYQFFLWEILIDSKIISLFGIIFLIYKKLKLNLVEIFKNHFHFYLKINILFFFAVLAVVGAAIVFGYVFKQIEFVQLKNPETLLLGMVFDIPAMYIFSLTTIFIEELFFRIFLIELFSQTKLLLRAVVISILWSMYSISDVIYSDWNFLDSIIYLLYSFSLSFFLITISKRFNSLWTAYSFRIGIASIVPLGITTLAVESDSFFSAASPLFKFEGIPVSLMLLLSALYFLKSKEKENTAIA